jgi:hypothetical protein
MFDRMAIIRANTAGPRCNAYNRASWDRARHLWAHGLVGDAAFNRFERLWAWSTATEHPLTRHASLDRWTSRRDRIRNALCAIGA